VLRELEQVQRALDVDVMRRNRRELGTRREQRSQVDDEIDLEFRKNPLEEVGIGDGAGEIAEGELA